MEFIVPENILSIISILNKNGFQAHLAGGCVRDMIIGRVPGDWDITTNASTDEVKSLFQKTWDTGLRHGTVTVSYNGTKAEVTTWRKEEGYSDHRRPDRVYFAQSLTDDLSRRDFTINAMAYHPDEGLIDPFGGLNDINLRLIRSVGDPIKRFSEDALRMLRAVRFSAQLGFDIEINTFNAIKELWADLSYISMERIQAETNKILESSEPHKLSLIWETGLNKTIFPEISISPCWIDLAKKFSCHKNRKPVLLAMLFITSVKDDAENTARFLLNRLRYDKATIRHVADLINCVLDFGPFTPRNLRKMATEYGEETAYDAVLMKKALKGYGIFHGNQNGLTNQSFRNTELSCLKLNISGKDLKDAGLCQGSEIKNMLSVLSLIVYEKPCLNDAALLMELATKIARISF